MNQVLNHPGAAYSDATDPRACDMVAFDLRIFPQSKGTKVTHLTVSSCRPTYEKMRTANRYLRIVAQ